VKTFLLNIKMNKEEKSSNSLINIINNGDKPNDRGINNVDKSNDRGINNVDKSNDKVVNKSNDKVNDLHKSFNITNSNDSGENIRTSNNIIVSDEIPPLMKSNTSAYIKTVQRRGNTYMIRESLPSDDDMIESDSMERMINDLYAESIHLSIHANRKASILKAIHIMTTMFITIAGAVIGVLSIDHEDDASKYTAGILGFSISVVKTLSSTFSVEKKSVLLKETAAKLRKISRDVRSLQNEKIKPKKKLSKLDQYYAQVDELDLNMFDTNAVPIAKKNTKTSSDMSSESEPDDEPPKMKKNSSVAPENRVWFRRGSAQGSYPIPPPTPL
jgi:hypothetical protein